MSRREKLLVEALIEYIEQYGVTEKAKKALDVLGTDVLLKANYLRLN